jgi:DNA processing protein
MIQTLCLAKYFQNLLHSPLRKQIAHEKVLALLNSDGDQQAQFIRENIEVDQYSAWVLDFQNLLRLNVKFTFPGDQCYPRSFGKMEYSPYLLSYIGSPVWLDLPGLAIVGSREATRASLEWMEENLASWLHLKAGYIVSGGARGIDQKAHELSLRCGVPTVAVIPSGLGNIYPPSLRSWVSEIIQSGGALVSEYGYKQELRKHFFQARNRIISGLGTCSLIIQAERASGTMITARQSLEQTRPLLVVPSHPLEISHQGGLDLIVEGATPIRDAQDLKLIFDVERLSEEMISRPLGQGTTSHH